MARKKNAHPPGLGQGSGYYTQQIVKRLENAFRYSHQRPYQLFNDWIRIVEVTLDDLPEQLKAVAQTGRLAPDPPQTAEVFNEVRARYENPQYPAAQRQVWHSFTEAFALLLESAEPGLWGAGSYGEFDCGSAGPDVIGQVFIEFSHPSPHTGQYLTPWPVVMLISQVSGGGPTEVYARLKQACQHPDNVLAHAVLLAGLAIEDPQLVSKNRKVH